MDARRETVLESGEIVTEIELSPEPGIRSSYRKVRTRASWDFALSGVALAIRFQNDVVSHARVVLSGAAPAPWRSKESESAMVGSTFEADVIERGAGSMKNAQHRTSIRSLSLEE